MENLFGTLVTIALLLLIIGLFAPKISLFWYKNKTRKASLLIYGALAILFFVLFAINTDLPKTQSSSENETVSQGQEVKAIKVGDILHTSYFDVKVNHIEISNSVRTGNEFADLPAEEGVKYIIMNVTYKNTDTESRMIMDGVLWVNVGEKEYEFDKTETVMLDGWGILLDQINPMVSKTTNIVYKIPSDLSGDLYWQPGRADDDERIELGSL